MDNGACSYRRFLEGDENGIVAIIRDHKDGLIFYLDGFVRNIHIAEELAEETFIRLVVRKPRFNGRSTFKTWLYAIGRNVAIDYGRRRAVIAETQIEDATGLESDEEGLEQSYIREERRIVVHRALKRLNPDYRQVLYLTYFEGFDNAEAAAVMKKTRRQIENLLYRAKQSLKAELEREGFPDEEL